MEKTDKEVIMACYAMRQAQKQYFRTRDKADLNQSKRLEVEVDKLLVAALAKRPPGSPQVAPMPGLFDRKSELVMVCPHCNGHGSFIGQRGKSDTCEDCGGTGHIDSSMDAVKPKYCKRKDGKVCETGRNCTSHGLHCID